MNAAPSEGHPPGLAGRPVECSEAALLAAMAANIGERCTLYRDRDLSRWASDLAAELAYLAAQLGPDPLGIGEGEVARG